MENFEFQCATKIIFGKDTENLVGKELKKHTDKVLLHYGSGSIKKTGLYDKVVKSLNDADVEFLELPGVVPNPRAELVYKGIELCKKEDIKFILAVGGGSVIDSAKAIAAGFYYDGDFWDLYEHKAKVGKTIPLATVLTLPAAGSEASMSSVVTKGNRKLAIGSNSLRPVFSILNPELTFTLPAWQTAAGVTDMMAHIFERYFTNTKHVDLTDKMCESVLRSIIKNARLALKNPEDYNARAEIMWAGTLAHNGLLGTGREEDWATHRIEHELSAFYDITHGAGLAIIFPAWMKYNYKHDIKRFVQFANEVWRIEGDDEKAVLKGIQATSDFFKEIGMPVSISELKLDIKDEDMKKMAEYAVKFGNLGNFVSLGKEDIYKIYKLAE